MIKALERAVSGLEKSSKIFELGSGSGEDACHLRHLGYEVEVSDLSQNYVDLLNNSGFKARRLDALNDQFPQSYDLIIANFLLQHFPSQQLETIITKVFRSLKPGGRFSFTIAGGKGEGLLKDFDGRSFYWCRWSEDDLRYLLEQTGFQPADILSYPGMNQSLWLLVFVEKPDETKAAGKISQ